MVLHDLLGLSSTRDSVLRGAGRLYKVQRTHEESVNMNGWSLNKQHLDGGMMTKPVLCHRDEDGYCSWGNRDKEGWYCVMCGEEPPEEIQFVADLADCYCTPHPIHKRPVRP